MSSAPSRRRAERFLWLVALICGTSYVGGVAIGRVERGAALNAFADALAASRAAEPAGAPTAATANPSVSPASPPDLREWSPTRIAHFRLASAPGAEVAAMPRAVLSIPRLALEVPVFDALTERNLNRGVALIPTGGDPAAGPNIAIAGHRDGWFRGLKDVEVGDLIELQDLAARRRYRIRELRIVEPVDLAPLSPTPEPALTLITCYPFYFVGDAPRRFVVRATAEP